MPHKHVYVLVCALLRQLVCVLGLATVHDTRPLNFMWHVALGNVTICGSSGTAPHRAALPMRRHPNDRPPTRSPLSFTRRIVGWRHRRQSAGRRQQIDCSAAHMRQRRATSNALRQVSVNGFGAPSQTHIQTHTQAYKYSCLAFYYLTRWLCSRALLLLAASAAQCRFSGSLVPPHVRACCSALNFCCATYPTSLYYFASPAFTIYYRYFASQCNPALQN